MARSFLSKNDMASSFCVARCSRQHTRQRVQRPKRFWHQSTSQAFLFHQKHLLNLQSQHFESWQIETLPSVVVKFAKHNLDETGKQQANQEQSDSRLHKNPQSHDDQMHRQRSREPRIS